MKAKSNFMHPLKWTGFKIKKNLVCTTYTHLRNGVKHTKYYLLKTDL